MTPDLSFAAFGLVLVCAGVVVGWWWRGLVDARRAFDAEMAAKEQVLAARQAGRHAKTQPRVDRIAAPGPAGHQHLSPRLGRTGPQPAPARQSTRRLVTTAADLAPVIIPNPGTQVPMRPQAPRTSGAGTQTLPRLTDTGELRAVADAWAERTRREQAVWSHEFAQRCAKDRKELLP